MDLGLAPVGHGSHRSLRSRPEKRLIVGGIKRKGKMATF